MSGNQLIQVVCTKERCKECVFCGGKKVLEIGGGKGWV
jgi:histone acetyltransferase (RNA polymerase elongator complex component)